MAAAQILQDQALEQVVDVAHREGQVDAGVAFDFAFALEVADAAENVIASSFTEGFEHFDAVRAKYRFFSYGDAMLVI